MVSRPDRLGWKGVSRPPPGRLHTSGRAYAVSRARVAAQARLGASCRAGLGPLDTVLCCARVGPKRQVTCQAGGPWAAWTSIRTYVQTSNGVESKRN